MESKDSIKNCPKDHNQYSNSEKECYKIVWERKEMVVNL